MMTLGPFLFAAPWALAALAALPVIWLVLRAAPPAPKRVAFPPLRLLLGLKTAEETTGRPPWWLLLIRALAAALLIIGFARPSLAPEGGEAAPLSGSMLLVIDDGWTSAADFDALRSAADASIARAERSGQSVSILTTAPVRPAAKGPLDALAAADARTFVNRLEPKAWRPDRAAALARLNATTRSFADIQWLSDGLDDADAAAFSAALAARGPTTLRSPGRSIVALADAAAKATGVEVTLRRSSPLSGDGSVAAETSDGRPLGAAPFAFPPGALETTATIAMPGEIAARAARVRIVNDRSAGAVRLIPSAAGRPLVGLIDAGGQSQPLLSDLFYVDRAIEPFAQVRRGAAQRLVDEGVDALVLPDASRLAPGELRRLEQWLDQGGLLIRFAGPRLANDSDGLLPAAVRRGERRLGGALAWEQPQTLKPFDPESPFYGLEPPVDVTVSRQVMIAPDAEQAVRVWARLTDGAPVITAAARGRGMVVLFHIGAGPDWSTLPLSGLYVEMLRRVLMMAGRMPGDSAGTATASGPFVPRRLLDGRGGWIAPTLDAAPIPADAFDGLRAGPTSPPGLYERGGASSAIQTIAAKENLQPLPSQNGLTVAAFAAPQSRPLSGLVLGLAGLLLALDLILALWLTGRLPTLRPWAKAASALVLAAILVAPSPAAAQSIDSDADIRLAYVRTGDARTDATMKAGLDALAATLRQRTAVEPGTTVGVDLARDDLSVYPLIYWSAPATPRPLPDAALANLDRYMRLGGMLFVDTRDAGRGGAAAGPAAVMLRGLDAPPLEPVTGEHVLTKAFYLLQSFPGRTDSTQIFAETPGAAAARDGVPALLIGNGDWASIWAQSSSLDANSWFSEEARRRELALRFGVNLVMVALTGNYKADQVHVPALLERLGQEEGRRR